MSIHRVAAVLAIGLLLAFAVSGCRGVPRDASGASASRQASGQTPSPSSSTKQLAALTETRAPAWAFRDFYLPAGCSVTDNTDTLAAYEQSTWQPYPGSVIGLLDLEDGRSRTVLDRPMLSARAFDAFTPMLSDSWLVWEEVSPGESNSPRDAEWRLYASAIERDTLRIGEPRLIDEGTTDYKLRPYYGVDGSTVYWSVTTLSSPHQEHVGTSGRVEALDLATGAHTTLYGSGNPLLSLRVSDGHVVIVEDARVVAAPGEATAGGATMREPPRRDRAVVIDVASGAEVLRYDLPTAGPPGHFADHAEGWLAWASFSEGGGEWPDLYLRSPDGQVSLGSRNGIDPVTAGRFLAFETVAVLRRPSGLLDRRREIWCIDLGRPAERFRLLATSSPEEGWWQTTRAGRTHRLLVLWNDLGPWTPEPAKARTIVRAYRACADR